ncbi:MAG TPA: hypothetical protein VFO73_06075 [Candidatus Limnocylindrales bacterium]|nr:hypothetical protein [Candidatus Limnocylindrales bacterium]
MPRETEPHVQHDPLLVVALAAGDLAGADRNLAAAQLADCAECSTLHDDLLAVARATAALPAARRSRDFRLTPADAARLRPLGWRRFIAAFAGPRLAFTRQLGVGLTTLGLAGLLFTALPGFSLSMGGAAAAPSAAVVQELQTDQSFAAPSAADAHGQGSGAGLASQPAAAQASPGADEGPNDGDTTGRTSASAPELGETLVGTDESPSPSPLLIGSVVALGIGLALLLARSIGRRMANH